MSIGALHTPSAPYPAEGPGVEAQGGLKSGMGMSGSGGVVLPLWGRSADSLVLSAVSRSELMQVPVTHFKHRA